MKKNIIEQQHNKKALKKILKCIKNKIAFLCSNCTGSGKSYLIKKTIENVSRPLLITPDKKIISDIDIDTMTYAKFVRDSTYKVLKNNYDTLIFDEAHHLGSDGCRRMMKKLNKNVYGFSATPLRLDGIDVSKEYFNQNNICTLDIKSAWDKDIFRKPNYIVTTLHKRKKKGEKNIPIAEKSINRTFEKHIKDRNKIVVYCSNNIEMEYFYDKLKSKFEHYGFVCFMHSDKHLNNAMFDNYINAKSSKLVMFSINKLIEGHHIKNLDCILVYRTTKSFRIYSQMLGRICHYNSNKKANVIDFVNNVSIFETHHHDDINSDIDFVNIIRNYADKVIYEVDYDELEIDICRYNRKYLYKNKYYHPKEIAKLENLTDWTFLKYLTLNNGDVEKAIRATKKAMKESPENRRIEEWKRTYEGKVYSNFNEIIAACNVGRDRLQELWNKYGKDWEKHLIQKFHIRYGITLEEFIKPYKISHAILNTWARKEGINVQYSTKEIILDLIKRHSKYTFEFRGKIYKSIHEAIKDNNLDFKDGCVHDYYNRRHIPILNSDKGKLLEEYIKIRNESKKNT